jgi:hypothetical protein
MVFSSLTRKLLSIPAGNTAWNFSEAISSAGS